MKPSFRGVPPRRFDEEDVEDSRMCPEFVVHYPSGSRFREAELLEGLRAAVLSLGLAKVVHWSRSAGTWICNVWE